MLATLISCGGDNSSKSSQNEVDIDKVLNKLVNDKVIDENTKKSILSEYNNVKDSTEEAESQNDSEIDISKALKINSFDMFEEIYKDRSLYLSKYIDKEMILSDLLVKNVKTIEREGKFIKCVVAVPCNVKKQMVGVNFNYDSYEKPNVYFKSQYLMPFYELASTEPIFIELKNPDEFKKLNMLEWEYNVEDSGDDNTYYRKISIAGKITDRDNISFSAGSNANDDIKAKRISVTIRNAVIVK